VRLNLFLARAGRGSRREADEWIREGRVQVNGVTPEENRHTLVAHAVAV